MWSVRECCRRIDEELAPFSGAYVDLMFERDDMSRCLLQALVQWTGAII
jgi:hypothetical protein